MTKRKILLLSATCVIVVVVVAIKVIQFRRILNEHVVNLTDEQARLILGNEAPIGTTKSNVKQFLDARRWPHSDVGSTVQTMVRDASHDFLIRRDIQIRFLFDSKDELISYEIKDILTGP
jgi:hypothetical protein